MSNPQCPNCGVRHRPGSKAERDCQGSPGSSLGSTGLMSWVPGGAGSAGAASGDFGGGDDYLPPTNTGPVKFDGPDVFHDSAPDEIVNCDGMEFFRADAVTSDNYVAEPYYIRVQFDREMTDEQMNHAAQLMGYAYRETVAGESLGWPVADGTNSFYLHADTTKSRRDDLGVALAEFEEKFPERMAEGSPVRKSDRLGPGTKGTRLVEPLGPEYGNFTLYYG